MIGIERRDNKQLDIEPRDKKSFDIDPRDKESLTLNCKESRDFVLCNIAVWADKAKDHLSRIQRDKEQTWSRDMENTW